jgi:hypothetical protein
MKKYVAILFLLIVQNVCAMEMSSVLEKYSRKPNQKIRIGAGSLLAMNIRRYLPFELQRNIFVMMHELYEAKKEIFIEVKVSEFKFFVDRGNKLEWSLAVKLKDNYTSLIKSDLRQLFNKTENHSFCRKNDENKVLVAYGDNYIENIQYLMDHSRFPETFHTIDMTETITNFIKEHYESIIMFWSIVNTK